MKSKATMATKLPQGAQAEFDKIIKKLLKCLEMGARKQLEARSEFVDYDGEQGGPMLEADPEIKHPYNELNAMYVKLFAKAKAQGLELREIVTTFKRRAGKEWTYDTRLVTAATYDDFVESVEAIVDDIRVALRRLADKAAKDWEEAELSGTTERPWELRIVRDDDDLIKEPPKELVNLVKKVEAKAKDSDLRFEGATWIVQRDMDDDEGEIESSIYAR
jgi:hypothetical protein